MGRIIRLALVAFSLVAVVSVVALWLRSGLGEPADEHSTRTGRAGTAREGPSPAEIDPGERVGGRSAAAADSDANAAADAQRSQLVLEVVCPDGPLSESTVTARPRLSEPQADQTRALTEVARFEFTVQDDELPLVVWDAHESGGDSAARRGIELTLPATLAVSHIESVAPLHVRITVALRLDDSVLLNVVARNLGDNAAAYVDLRVSAQSGFSAKGTTDVRGVLSRDLAGLSPDDVLVFEVIEPAEEHIAPCENSVSRLASDAAEASLGFDLGPLLYLSPDDLATLDAGVTERSHTATLHYRPRATAQTGWAVAAQRIPIVRMALDGASGEVPGAARVRPPCLDEARLGAGGVEQMLLFRSSDERLAAELLLGDPREVDGTAVTLQWFEVSSRPPIVATVEFDPPDASKEALLSVFSATDLERVEPLVLRSVEGAETVEVWGLEAASYVLVARSDGCDDAVAPWTAGNGPALLTLVSRSATYTVTGLVMASTESFAVDTNIYARRIDQPSTRVYQTSPAGYRPGENGADGAASFALEDLPAGRYELSLSAPFGQEFCPARMEIDVPGAPVRFEPCAVAKNRDIDFRPQNAANGRELRVASLWVGENGYPLSRSAGAQVPMILHGMGRAGERVHWMASAEGRIPEVGRVTDLVESKGALMLAPKLRAGRGLALYMRGPGGTGIGGLEVSVPGGTFRTISDDEGWCVVELEPDQNEIRVSSDRFELTPASVAELQNVSSASPDKVIVVHVYE